MKILVTGCCGFIGSHTSEKLLELNHQVVGIDIMNDYYYSTLLKYDNKNKKKVIGVGNNQNLKREITLNGMIKKNPIFSKEGGLLRPFF